MLYLSRVDLDTGVVVATLRAFQASVLHGSTSAIVGMALAGFPLGRVNNPLLRWLVGLAVAITIHTAYNDTAFHHFVFGQTGFLVLSVIAFSALAVVAGAILWGLRIERRRLRKSLRANASVSKGEALLVDRIEDLEELLAPVEERYGEVKREQAANALLLAAQVAMKQDQLRKTRDPELRAELAPQITSLKVELKQARDDVGIYIMSYVRSIMPKTTWSLWARLEQARSKLTPAAMNIWTTLVARLPGQNSTAITMHARILAELEARARSAALAVEGEEE
jgi:hypothetical protein